MGCIVFVHPWNDFVQCPWKQFPANPYLVVCTDTLQIKKKKIHFFTIYWPRYVHGNDFLSILTNSPYSIYYVLVPVMSESIKLHSSESCISTNCCVLDRELTFVLFLSSPATGTVLVITMATSSAPLISPPTTSLLLSATVLAATARASVLSFKMPRAFSVALLNSNTIIIP